MQFRYKQLRARREELPPRNIGALYASDYDARQDPGTTDESVDRSKFTKDSAMHVSVYRNE
jgi:hypothetical protein